MVRNFNTILEADGRHGCSISRTLTRLKKFGAATKVPPILFGMEFVHEHEDWS